MKARLKKQWVLLGQMTLAFTLVWAGSAALADNGPDHRASQPRPISLGTSGGNINDRSTMYCCSGTLGCLVVDEEGVQYILSNNHVLGRANQAAPGEPVNQPGMIDQGCQQNGIVAEVAQVALLEFRKGRSTPLNLVDAAIARVLDGQVRTDGDIIDIGGLSSETITAYPGQAVQKSGRTTGHTQGVVAAVDVTVDVGYSKECGGSASQVARFVNQIRISDGSFSAGGDSGSVIVESGALGSDGLPRAVGLLFAGSADSTIANPVDAVLAAFGVSMAVGTPPSPPDTGGVSGTVTDAGSGLPIAGAVVRADTGQQTSTDLVGVYSLAEVPVGDRTVAVSALGYATASQTVTVTKGAVVSADFALEVQPAATLAIASCIIYNTSGGKNADRNLLITVRVVDDLGQPVPNAVVDIAVSLDGAPHGNGTGAVTDASGEVTYISRNAPNGVYATVVSAVTKIGLAFEGSTPVNSFTKGTEPVPSSHCLPTLAGAAAGADPVRAALDLNRARQIKRRHGNALLELPTVAGHGIGLHNGRPAIEVYLTEDDPRAVRQIPAALEGVPVRVVVTGPFLAF